ncbi:MAG TPA: replicative DNA helicase, partial [Capsulimonadaceae bacterium]|nr:replicative DNA helicase [Capsulimonadaceae bacterium]
MLDQDNSIGRDDILQRLPPHSIEAEQSVLGAMFLEQAAIEKVAEMLSPEDFYREAHQTLFEAILAISGRSEPLDLITIQEELRRHEKLDLVGGMGYLTRLLDAVPTAAHVEHYAKIVEEKAILRRLIDASLQVVGMARSPEVEAVDELIDKAERLIFNVSQRRMSQYFTPLPPLLIATFDRAEELNELKSKVSGLSTGIHDFDMMTAGLQKSDMIILAARPSMGKTSLALSLAQHVALREKQTVAIFSLEMSKEQLALRMLCSEAQVSS